MAENEEKEPAADLFRGKSSAQRKWDEERGEEVCYIAGWLSPLHRDGIFVYEIVYRVDLLQKNDNMLLLKAVLNGEAVVAFVYSTGLLTGLSNLAGLFRSGKLKWSEDRFPSAKVKKSLEQSNK